MEAPIGHHSILLWRRASPQADEAKNAPSGVPSLRRSPRRPPEDGRLAMTAKNVNLKSQKWFFKTANETIPK